MIVMPSDFKTFECGVMFGKHPDRMGSLHNVDRPKIPFTERWAVDNGVYGAVSNEREWEEKPFYKFLDRFANKKPMWAVVPDALGNRDLTLERWEIHAPRVAEYGVPLAFAVQDGMTPADVPSNADLVFVGGTTKWKWRNLRTWTSRFRTHVGRVNSYRMLWMADKAGAESCDGTGWFRGGEERYSELYLYLEQSTEGGHPQMELIADEG